VAEDDSSRVLDRVRLLNASRTVLFADIPVYKASDTSGSVEVAFQWTTGTDEQIHSIVNGRTALFGLS
jgi:DNA gyrase/topoisomerase IV subunit B